MRRILCFFLSTLIASFGGYAHASVIKYTATLSGLNESPANASPGTGNATVMIDSNANTMALHVSFSGLLGTTKASHIHCCTSAPFAGNAGVATTTPSFAGFPTGVTSGTYDVVLDLLALGTYNSAFVSAHGNSAATSEKALLDGLALGEGYLNIHTSAFAGGEIRGFLTAAAVPEPSSFALLALGMSLLVAGGRKRRS